ncbi:MAG: hypothetical protein DRH11_12890 [Deltaproteobacteria bacterium]|nr:MAG: hypothetical protein DRH11_12890 [Deltaproteobacteria bacterium]
MKKSKMGTDGIGLILPLTERRYFLNNINRFYFEIRVCRLSLGRILIASGIWGVHGIAQNWG